eukprot:m.481998 g.481998  ORF g.481998 m.481998 type:complete len:138 (+) comp22400_c0_seq1:2297-2710(+)
MSKNATAAAATQGPTPEQIVKHFQSLNAQQQQMAQKLMELENELHEHTIVGNALQETSGDRKCFRLVGGVLVERTVKEVLPAVEENKNMITQVVAKLNEDLKAKSQEISDFREKYNIRFKNEVEQEQETKKQSGVLV